MVNWISGCPEPSLTNISSEIITDGIEWTDYTLENSENTNFMHAAT